MKDNLIIIGTGDYAEVAYQYLKDSFEVVCFMVNEAFLFNDVFCGKKVLALENIKDQDPINTKIFIAIGPNGNNKTREKIYRNLKEKTTFKFIKYIHPDSHVWSIDAIGENTMIFPKCVVEPFATIGVNCVLWSSSVVAHHSKIGDHTFLAPSCSISGRVNIANNCFIGINSTIRDNINIEANTIIGAGSVIKKDTVENGVYSKKSTPLFNKDSLKTKV